MTSRGDVVTVRGETYRVTGARSTSSSGSKFYGKYRFYLTRVSDGAEFTAYGKSVAHNSRLSARESWDTGREDA